MFPPIEMSTTTHGCPSLQYNRRSADARSENSNTQSVPATAAMAPIPSTFAHTASRSVKGSGASHVAAGIASPDALRIDSRLGPARTKTPPAPKASAFASAALSRRVALPSGVSAGGLCRYRCGVVFAAASRVMLCLRRVRGKKEVYVGFRQKRDEAGLVRIRHAARQRIR